MLDSFQWAYPDRSENRGEVSVIWDTSPPTLHLEVWTQNTEDPDDPTIHPLSVTRPVDPERRPTGPDTGSLIHWHLAHESDEQMWFGDDRPFYPHDAEGNTITVEWAS